MSKRLRNTLAAALLTASLIGVTACSSDEKNEATPTNATSSSASESSEPTTDETTETEEPATDDNAKALETYAGLEQAQLDQMDESLKDIYSDIKVETAPPGGMVFTYTYKDQTDAAAAVEYFEGQVETLQKLCDDQVFPAMEQTGVKGPKSITYTYLNSDGSEIWSKKFDS